jgi:hypothetical protein
MTAKLDAKYILMMLLLIAVTALAACGGGGDEVIDPNLPTPSITGLSVSVANAGDTVEIYGLNFGLTQGSGSASCNGTDFTITTWTETKITTTVPAGMTSGIVMVRQNTKSSTSGAEAQLYIGTMPEGDLLISAINPNYGNTGDEILIIGRNFGESATAGTVYFLPKTVTSQATPVPAEVVTVDVGGTPTAQWTRTSIKVKVPGEALQAGEATVYVAVGTKQSNVRPFTKLPDQIVGSTQIDLLDPVDGPVGTLVTITGTGFGFSQGSSTITIGGVPLDVIDWTNTQILANIPAGALAGAIRLVVGGMPFDSQPFTVGNSPVISGVSPSAVRVGSSVTVYGTFFGSNPGTGSLKIGSTTVAVDDSNWDTGRIFVPKLPKLIANDPADVPVVVTADNGLTSEPFSISLTSDLSVFTTVDPPAGEVGTTTFTFTVLASGGSGEYSYELIPDDANLGVVKGPYDNPAIDYSYPASSGYKTTTFHTKVRVTDKNSSDSTTVAGPDVLVVAQGAPVIINMSVHDFNRGGINAPNDWCLDTLTNAYHDFSFSGGETYFTSALSAVTVGTNTLPPFVRDERTFMNNGSSIIGSNPRAYGYRYGTPGTPAPGSYVRITGLNFGDATGKVWMNASLDASNNPTGAQLDSTDIIEWTSQAIVVRMPASMMQNLSGTIVLQTADSKVIKSAKPLVASAYIQALNPVSWEPGGPATVTLEGFDFQPPQIAGVTGTGTYMLWMVWAQYNDPFAGNVPVTRRVLRIQPIVPSSVTNNLITFPTTILTGDVQIEVTDAARENAQIVPGTLSDGDYYFWLWTGAIANGSYSQIATSGIFSQAYKFTRGPGGGPGPGTFTISGKVTDIMLPPPNDGAAGVTLNLTGTSTASTVSAADGTYSFTGLANGNYTVTPTGGGFTSFAPASAPVTIAGANQANINFAGSSMPGP